MHLARRLSWPVRTREARQHTLCYPAVFADDEGPSVYELQPHLKYAAPSECFRRDPLVAKNMLTLHRSALHVVFIVSSRAT